VTTSQCHSATRDLAVGRLDDLSGFPNGQASWISWKNSGSQGGATAATA